MVTRATDDIMGVAVAFLQERRKLTRTKDLGKKVCLTKSMTLRFKKKESIFVTYFIHKYIKMTF